MMRGAGGTPGGVGALIIVAGILANLHIYFQATSLFDTLIILGLLAAGIGLVARSLRPHPDPTVGTGKTQD